jgi:DNA polymerase
MLAYAVNDGPVRQWIPAEDEDDMPEELMEMLLDPLCVKFAWNKGFEWSMFTHVLGIEIPHEQWRDPMVMAYSCALPGALEKAGAVLGLDDDKKKQTRGRALMKVFSWPRKATKNMPWTRVEWWMDEAKWEEYKEYNRQDVIAERSCYKKLKAYDMPPWEWTNWLLDQRINQAGIPINMNMVDNAVEIYEEVIADRINEMKHLTGLDNPASPKQLLPWMKDKGYPFDDCVAAHIRRAYDKLTGRLESEDGDNYIFPAERREAEDLHRVLGLRLEVSQTSPKKYHALQRSVDRKSCIVRNAFQFAGAGRTWRFAGRLFQVQNLPRPLWYLEDHMEHVAYILENLDYGAIEAMYEKPMDVLKSGIRPAAQAPEGKVFIDADLSAIENRVLGWLSECEKILNVFRDGKDPYLAFSVDMKLHANYKEAHAAYLAGDKTNRTLAKPGVLGCGYQLGAGKRILNRKTGEVEGTGLLGYAWNMGIEQFTVKDSKLSVDTFRGTFKEVPEYWKDIEAAAKKCIQTGRPVDFGLLQFDRKGPFLRMKLPSGRYLHYCRPRIELVMAPWGKEIQNITYEGLTQNGHWGRINTHGGKLTENADQAISRDLLMNAMRLADAEGLDIRIHVHDEILALSDEDKAEAELQLLMDCLNESPDWAKGLPLASAGYISRIFIKD